MSPTVIHLHPSALQVPADKTTPEAVELATRIVARFESADDILRLVVDEALIHEIRRQPAVELVFDPPRPLTLQRNGRQLTVHALLVPLDGELAGEHTVVFYATDEHYASGPVRHAGSSADIAEWTAQLLAERESTTRGRPSPEPAARQGGMP